MGYSVRGWHPSLKALVFLAGVVGWSPWSEAAEPVAEKKAFMVTDYSYEPSRGATGNLDIGLSLCGTRCNALSGDFASYIKPGGWRLIKVASKVEIKVELNNPFLAGQCVCVGDEYKIDWYDQATYSDRPEPPPPEIK
ncbi:MAG: hypothetical protein HGA96_04130 [Desulfobulbaceae bacterium]|nr:hypothetical protein [Desulfobulbaceae bacterium]